MRNGRRKQFGVLQANIIYLTVCCIFLSYKNENPYSAFTTETSIWNQTYPSQSISICFPKIWLTLGKSFLPSGPLFPHLQSAWAAPLTLILPSLSQDKADPSLLSAQWFSLCFHFPAIFCSRLVFSNHSVLMEPKYLSIFLLFNCKESIKDKTGWGPDSLSLNRQAVVWKYPFRHKHFETKVETDMEKTKVEQVPTKHIALFSAEIFFSPVV